jgi:AraC-like DNA-binding protein
MANLTDAGTLVRLAYQGLVNLGIDANEVLKRSGLEPERLYKSNLRTQFSAQPRFWQAAAELSGDPSIGLHVGEKMPIYKGQIIEYLFLSSANFGDGLRRNINYQRLVSDALQARLVDQANPYITSYFVEEQFVTSHLSEALTLGVIKGFQACTDGVFKPEKILFRHSPNTDLAEYERIFQCEVKFNADEFRLYFPREILDYRSLNSAPELLNLHMKVADEHMALLQQQDFIGEVNGLIAALLESGETTLESVATKLEMTPRQLRHQLKTAGTSFQQLLNKHRHSLARRLLSKTDQDISEIVYLTGFSEPSTFYRAFRRWENTTPIEYRQKFRNPLT